MTCLPHISPWDLNGFCSIAIFSSFFTCILSYFVTTFNCQCTMFSLLLVFFFFMVIDKFSLIYDLNVYACVSSISASFVLRINYIFVHILYNSSTSSTLVIRVSISYSSFKLLALVNTNIFTTGSNIFSPKVLFDLRFIFS